MSVIERVEELEARARRMEARLAALEGRRIDAPARPVEWRPMEPVGAPPPPPASFAPPVSTTPPPSPSARPRAPRPELSLEDLLGGRVLAWAGGLSLLAGLLFLLVVAISRGWLGEEDRTALAAAMSLGLLMTGIRAYEHRGRTDSALAATATGIAGLFASAVVAVQAYALIPAVTGLAVAFAVGATATWLAVRWEARGIAALGILGAISAPVLVAASSRARRSRSCSSPLPRRWASCCGSGGRGWRSRASRSRRCSGSGGCLPRSRARRSRWRC